MHEAVHESLQNLITEGKVRITHRPTKIIKLGHQNKILDNKRFFYLSVSSHSTLISQRLLTSLLVKRPEKPPKSR